MFRTIFWLQLDLGLDKNSVKSESYTPSTHVCIQRAKIHHVGKHRLVTELETGPLASVKDEQLKYTSLKELGFHHESEPEVKFTLEIFLATCYSF